MAYLTRRDKITFRGVVFSCRGVLKLIELSIAFVFFAHLIPYFKEHSINDRIILLIALHGFIAISSIAILLVGMFYESKKYFIPIVEVCCLFAFLAMGFSLFPMSIKANSNKEMLDSAGVKPTKPGIDAEGIEPAGVDEVKLEKPFGVQEEIDEVGRAEILNAMEYPSPEDLKERKRLSHKTINELVKVYDKETGDRDPISKKRKFQSIKEMELVTPKMETIPPEEVTEVTTEENEQEMSSTEDYPIYPKLPDQPLRAEDKPKKVDEVVYMTVSVSLVLVCQIIVVCVEFGFPKKSSASAGEDIELETMSGSEGGNASDLSENNQNEDQNDQAEGPVQEVQEPPVGNDLDEEPMGAANVVEDVVLNLERYYNAQLIEGSREVPRFPEVQSVV